MSNSYELPCENEYTIYSKSGCINCKKAKTLLEKEKVIIIDCDEYLIEDKESFLSFIKSLSDNIECKTFPIIFYKKKFIGGYNELQEFYQNENLFNNDNDF
jgi:glutaredoxin